MWECLTDGVGTGYTVQTGTLGGGDGTRWTIIIPMGPDWDTGSPCLLRAPLCNTHLPQTGTHLLKYGADEASCPLPTFKQALMQMPQSEGLTAIPPGCLGLEIGPQGIWAWRMSGLSSP